MTDNEFKQGKLLIKAYADNPNEPQSGLAKVLLGFLDYFSVKNEFLGEFTKFNCLFEKNDSVIKELNENLVHKGYKIEQLFHKSKDIKHDLENIRTRETSRYQMIVDFKNDHQSQLNELNKSIIHLQDSLNFIRNQLMETQQMAKLTAKTRSKIPASEFGEPKARKYPMPDKSHAANAKARASEEAKKGKLSGGLKKKIDAKANRILSKGKKKGTK
jgi:predicted  nucleic acid-binding Zn-ribbon protein